MSTGAWAMAAGGLLLGVLVLWILVDVLPHRRKPPADDDDLSGWGV